ncbi:hypothetical protein BEM40_018795 [Escherichia sp. MOD1-EC5451]|nr:hypothetical protein BEM40_018795 [Escherichia sp. MOD1-EC5451]
MAIAEGMLIPNHSTKPLSLTKKDVGIGLIEEAIRGTEPAGELFPVLMSSVEEYVILLSYLCRTGSGLRP